MVSELNVDGFGARLRLAVFHAQALKRGEIKPKDIAEELDLKDPGSVNRWRRGEVIPDLRKIGQLAEYLRVDPRWLAFGPDEEVQALPEGTTVVYELKDKEAVKKAVLRRKKLVDDGRNQQPPGDEEPPVKEA